MFNFNKFDQSVIFEDNHLLVVDKKFGIAVQGAEEKSLYHYAKRYLKEKYNKPGEAWVGIVHRLDQATGGVVILAKTSKAASRLSLQFREKKIDKYYLCLVENKVEIERASLNDWILKKDRHSVIGKAKKEAFKNVKLKYRKVFLTNKYNALSIKLLTGFYHQIRAQLSHNGNPICGDKKYGSLLFLGKGKIALICRKMVITHPVSGKKMVFKSRLKITELI